MSGHITRMSRGSSVGSSSRSPTSTSRSTSTCRAVPWQAWTCTERSAPARTRLASSAGPGARLARRSACSQPSRVAGSAWPAGCCSAGRSPSVRRSSRESRPREASRGCPTRSAERSSARATGPAAAVGASASHSAGEGCGSHRWTSRCSPRARSSSTSVTGRRVWPNRESRAGRSRPSAPSRSCASVVAWRRSGAGASTRTTSRRHSSACHRRSGSSVPPAPSVSYADAPVADELRALDGVGGEEAGEPAGHGVAAGRAVVGGVAAAEVAAEVVEAGGAHRLVDHLEQRPRQPVGAPGVLGVAVEQHRRPASGASRSRRRRTRRRRRGRPRRAGGRAAG